jgi:predicted Zn-dependent protease
LERETRYYLAKALIENGEKKEALPHLRKIGANTRTEQGAEARYMIADYYFNAGDDKQAEEEITNFIKEGTPHQYWLARAFVLLADISLKQGDTFQAKQYLNSLQANYKAEDSIQDLISERMDIINQSERESIEKTIEQDKGNTDATAATDENDNKETTEK